MKKPTKKIDETTECCPHCGEDWEFGCTSEADLDGTVKIQCGGCGEEFDYYQMQIKSDEKLNPELKKQIQETRSVILEQATKIEMPSRFKSEKSNSSPTMIITDTTTNRKADVPLFAYGNVRKVLSNLFSSEKKAKTLDDAVETTKRLCDALNNFHSDFDDLHSAWDRGKIGFPVAVDKLRNLCFWLLKETYDAK